MLDQNQTSYTLLGRAVDLNDDTAWEELYDCYNKFIYYFLHRMEVNASDLDDIAQQVMVTLTKDLKTYDRSKGPFRPWLRMVVRNTTLMFFRKQSTKKKYHDQLQQLVAVSETTGEASEFNEYFDQEWEEYILTMAIEKLKSRFSETAIHILQLERDGYSVEEMVEITGMKHDAVYKMRARIKKNLVLQARALIKELEGEE